MEYALNIIHDYICHRVCTSTIIMMLDTQGSPVDFPSQPPLRELQFTNLAYHFDAD